MPLYLEPSLSRTIVTLHQCIPNKLEVADQSYMSICVKYVVQFSSIIPSFVVS